LKNGLSKYWKDLIFQDGKRATEIENNCTYNGNRKNSKGKY
jgi:hypothetical protein